MKSKAEELAQFNDFLESLEKDGYLDMMFGKLQYHVEKQIADDITVDINSIICNEALQSTAITMLKNSLKSMEEMRDRYQKDYERGLNTITEQEKRIKNLEMTEDELRIEADQAHMRAQNYIDQLTKQPQLEGNLETAKKLLKISERKIQALKARIYDLQEDWQTLNEEKKEEVAKLKDELLEASILS